MYMKEATKGVYEAKKRPRGREGEWMKIETSFFSLKKMEEKEEC